MNILREGTPDEAGLLPERIDLIKERADGWVNEGITQSLVVLAARRGVVALHEAFGHLEPEPDSSPIALDTVFPAESIAKPVTATAVMLLVEEGLVCINRPVVDYIPELSGKGTENILVFHLLTHSSGFDFGLTSDVEIKAANVFKEQRTREGLEIPPFEPTQHEWIHLLLNARYALDPVHAPGEVMSYCNHNYVLLGEIVRRVSGMAFEDFTRKRIFEPLGMHNSSFRLEEEFRSRIVKRHPNSPGADFLNDEDYLDVPYGNSGLNTTTRDIAVFAQTFLNGGCYGDTRLLSRGTVGEMTRNQLASIRGGASYGLGFFVIEDFRMPGLNGSLLPRGTFTHLGAGGVNFWVDPVNEIVGAYFGVQPPTDSKDYGTTAQSVLQHPDRGDMFQNMITGAVVD